MVWSVNAYIHEQIGTPPRHAEKICSPY